MPQGLDWWRGLRAAVSTGVPLLLVVGLAGPDYGMFAVLGAYSCSYGAKLPYARRGPVLALIGAGFAVALMLGLAVAGKPWLVTLVLTLVAFGAVLLVDGLRSGGPGGFLVILVCALAAFLPAAPERLWGRTAALLTGVAVVWLVSMAGRLWRPYAVEQRAAAEACRATASLLEASGAGQDVASADAGVRRAVDAARSTLAQARGHGRVPVAQLRIGALLAGLDDIRRAATAPGGGAGAAEQAGAVRELADAVTGPPPGLRPFRVRHGRADGPPDGANARAGDGSAAGAERSEAAGPEAGRGAEAGVESRASAEAEVESRADAEAGVESRADAGAEPGTEAEAEPRADTKAEAEPRADAGAEPGTEAEAEPRADTKAEAEPRADTEAEAEPRADTKAEAEARAGTEAEVESRAGTEAEVEPGAGAKAGAGRGVGGVVARVVEEVGREEAGRLDPGWVPEPVPWWDGIGRAVAGQLRMAWRTAAAVGIGASLAQVLPLAHPAWMAVGAAQAMQGGHGLNVRQRVLRRETGTLAGVLAVGLLFHSAGLSGTHSLVVVVPLFALAQTVIARRLWAGTALTTVTALFLIAAARPGVELGTLAVQRLVDIGAGLAVGLAVGLLTHRRTDGRR